jgi:hypothetical protein
MIEINLLPPEHRPVERTPLPRLLTILVGVLLAMFGLVVWAWFTFILIPDAVTQRKDRVAKEASLKREADRVLELDRKMKVFEEREKTLRKLYKGRIRWTRVLERIAQARKTGGEVVLTSIKLKSGTVKKPGAKRGVKVKILDVRGYVPSYSEDAVAAPLYRPFMAFVEALTKDKKWKEIFEGDPEYKSMEMTQLTANKDKKGLPKAGFNFNVTFAFKSAEPPKRQRKAVKTPPPKKK